LKLPPPHKLLDEPAMVPGCAGTERTVIDRLVLLPQIDAAATEIVAEL
jgi:hypothetical protein